ncbi:efflux RND transporter permease subunit [Pontibacter virosus]
MLRFLLQRPVAVLMTLLALLVFSVLALWKLPLSLLPEAEVPQLVIKTSLPNAAPAEMEQNVLRPIRSAMLTLANLKEIESTAETQTGTIKLYFAHGAPMQLAYLEANEKLDRLMSALPRQMERPQIIKLNVADIPVARIQVVPRHKQSLAEVSELAEKVLRKRLEQLEGVSLVDLNGTRQRALVVEPDYKALRAYGLTIANITAAIQANNQELGALSVKDGHYRYYLKLNAKLKSPADIAQLTVLTPAGHIIPISRLAQVQEGEVQPTGYHIFNNQEAVVIAVHKQMQAQMTEMMPALYAIADEFRQDYPQLDFEVTQDQSLLLQESIGNLQGSLLWGGLFAFIVLFCFSGNVRVPLLVGLSLPISLLLSFLVFQLFGISVNIISLSGLALGLGMLIDNAIIVTNRIGQKRAAGVPLLDSCVEGTREMMAPLTSSVLTTLAVFVPLVFLNGLSGALFYDQAVAVAAILATSLAVSFLLLPLLYRLLFKNLTTIPAEDSRLYLHILTLYRRLHHQAMRRHKLHLFLLLLLLPLSLLLYRLIPLQGLPYLDKHDAVINLNWNEQLEVQENKNRTTALLESLDAIALQSEGEIGTKQFLLQESNNTTQEAQLYILFKDAAQKQQGLALLQQKIKERYPLAVVQATDAPNAFDRLFNDERPLSELRWRGTSGSQPIPAESLQALTYKASLLSQQNNLGAQPGKGTLQETVYNVSIRQDRLAAYNINYNEVIGQLRSLFGNVTVTDLKDFSTIIPVKLQESEQALANRLATAFASSTSGKEYSLDQLVELRYSTSYQSITADKYGIYHSLLLPDAVPAAPIVSTIKEDALQQGLQVNIAGKFLEDQENLQQLLYVLLLSVVLLYFILSAQFESLLQPVIVLLTLPLGIAGSLLLLYLAGQSLNIMSAIGMVVMLGVMVNDAILKIDNINRLRKQMPLKSAVAKAGEESLKPILMTSITTILALLPILFASGLGADLQRPLVLSVIGGLTVGTASATFFVPLLYTALYSKRRSIQQPVAA